MTEKDLKKGITKRPKKRQKKGTQKWLKLSEFSLSKFSSCRETIRMRN